MDQIQKVKEANQKDRDNFKGECSDLNFDFSIRDLDFGRTSGKLSKLRFKLNRLISIPHGSTKSFHLIPNKIHSD